MKSKKQLLESLIRRIIKEESSRVKYDGSSTLKPGTILGLGKFGQIKLEVIKDLGTKLQIKNITKNYNKAPFERDKFELKGAFVTQ